jgi:hypothetical protein
MIHEFKLPTDMAKVREKVMGLSSLWDTRLPDKPFFTLGGSAYLDIDRDDKSLYEYKTRTFNAPMVHCFGDLYKDVQSVLTDHLKIPCNFDHNYCVPGFHIFFSHEDFVTTGGPWHMDMGHIQLGLPEVDPISFTATIKLPTDGGGIQYKFTSGGEEHYLPYEVGGMILHDGCMMHKIAPLNSLYEDDERITMQGHGVKVDGEYVLFW